MRARVAGGAAEVGGAASGPLLQVDVMKGLAILAVLILHSVPKIVLYRTFAVFHVWQAVPVFCVLMGFTGGLSLRRRAKAGRWGPWTYLGGRLRRLGIPFAVAFLASLALIALGLVGRQPNFEWPTALSYLLTRAPGSYFITLVFQFALVFPLLGRMYAARPGWTVAGCFGLDLAFELVAPHVAAFGAMPYLYSGCVFRHFGAIALGLWLSDDPRPGAPRNRFLWAGCAVSVAFLAAFATSSYLVPWFLPNWKTQNLIASFYPAALVMLGARFLPAWPGGRVARVMAQAGRASYHIYLFNVLFLAAGASMVPPLLGLGATGGLAAEIPLLAVGVAANMAACFTAGWALWTVEHRVAAMLRVRAAEA
jgi:peptidoglycan/LPS O-acetylase OafA/YrhL